jgi:tRNA-2-methylthio-N6-dimethylallyladenosine synthase
MTGIKNYYIKTFGCQANLADAGTMGGILEALGYESYLPDEAQHEDALLADVLAHVDLLVINTCSVRQKSEDKVYGMGKMVKRAKHKPVIILAGCMVGSAIGDRTRFELAELTQKMPWVDAYISPQAIHTLPNILLATGKIDLTTVAPVTADGDYAYVNISTGCDNFCSYCVVPYARGKEVSRSRQAIVHDVTSLVDRGHKKIMLCGQNVNSWGLTPEEKFAIRSGDATQTPFAQLLRELHALDGIEELAFMSSNPFDFTQELVEVLQLPKLANYLHIAVQSGSNAVLKTMNRRHTVEEFSSLVKAIRRAVPRVELGTDIIVGFPGETREQFMATVHLVKQVVFKVIFISMYSPRPGTPAAKFYADDVSAKEKKWRHAYLTKVWRESLTNG